MNSSFPAPRSPIVFAVFYLAFFAFVIIGEDLFELSKESLSLSTS